MATLANVPCPRCDRVNRVDLSRREERPRCGACRAPLLLGRPMRLGEADFDRVISGSAVPVLVDFHADWCGPCKAMAPALEELADLRAGELIVAKLDTDRNRRIAGRFAIQAIPTVIVFEEGREVARQSGAMGRVALERLALGDRGGR